MMPSLEFSEEERLIEGAVSELCRRSLKAKDLEKFSRELFQRLGQEGYLQLGTSGHEGGLRAAVAAIEALGRACFPGPLIDAFIAAQLFEGELRERVCSGEAVCVVSDSNAFAFGDEADLFVELRDEEAFLVSPGGELETVTGLGNERWVRGRFVRRRSLGSSARATCVGDILLSSYLGQLGLLIVAKTAEHAATRTQFGRPIGSFQAVAHPLAAAHVALVSAVRVARAAACAFDEDDVRDAKALAEAALRSSRRAALEAAYVCHQKLGAIGITTEGPAYRATSRIRALSTFASGRLAAANSLVSTLGARR